MADEVVATWIDLLRQFRGPLVEALRWNTPALAELKRNHNPRRWQGYNVVVPVITAPLQGTGAISETGVVNEAKNIASEQATIDSAVLATPIAFSTKLIHASRKGDESWADVIPQKMQMAEDVFTRVMNEQLLGNGDALLAAITATSTGTTITLGATANWHQLYPGRVVDVKIRSTGADKATDLTITDISISAGTITVSSAVSVDANDGIYIEGSYGNAMQGLRQAVATTGTFQGISKASVWAWRGQDASPAAASDLNLVILDRAERQTRQLAGRTPDWYLCDSAVVDKFVQNMTLQARWSGEMAELKSGFEGVKYRSKALIIDDDMAAGRMIGVANEDWTLYALDSGPDWDEFTGSMFQRFGTRSLPVEAWLVWMVQVGFHRCNTFTNIGSLNQAT